MVVVDGLMNDFRVLQLSEDDTLDVFNLSAKDLK